MVYLTLQDPYYSQLFKSEKNPLNMQINNVVDYEINASIVAGKFETDEWRRYPDRDEFLNFRAKILRNDVKHDAICDEAFYQDGIAKFKGNANYSNSDRIRLVSDEIIYDSKKKVVKSDVNFTITQNSDKIQGKSVIYDINLKQMNATGVKAAIEERK